MDDREIVGTAMFNNIEEREIFDIVEKAFRFYRTDSEIEGAVPFVLFRPSAPLLQDGPQCGLVALTIAMQVLKPELNMGVQDWFSDAKEHGFTRHGEMFSAENMTQLVCKRLTGFAKLFQFSEEKSKIKTILDSLFRGNLVLVPYDSEANHEPALKKGHKAHWAVLLGFVAVRRTTDVVGQTMVLTHPTGTNIHVLTSIDCSETLCSDELFVVCRQGKSKHLGVWPMRQLLASNANLVEVAPSVLENADFIIPEIGIAATLRDKFVVLG